MPDDNRGPYSWAVIETDNFDGDYPDQKALSWVDSTGKSYRCRLTQAEAEGIAQVLNANSSRRFHRVVRLEHVLQPGFEP